MYCEDVDLAESFFFSFYFSSFYFMRDQGIHATQRHVLIPSTTIDRSIREGNGYLFGIPKKCSSHLRITSPDSFHPASSAAFDKLSDFKKLRDKGQVTFHGFDCLLRERVVVAFLASNFSVINANIAQLVLGLPKNWVNYSECDSLYV